MPAPETPGKCWAEPSRPSAELLAKLPAGQLSVKAGGNINERITLLRREKVTKPTIFVGTGTCGLGAGAAKTMAAAKAYLAEKKIDGEVVEVGCLGMCSEEPMLDVQLPGKARAARCRARIEHHLARQVRDDRRQACGEIGLVERHVGTSVAGALGDAGAGMANQVDFHHACLMPAARRTRCPGSAPPRKDRTPLRTPAVPHPGSRR